MKAIVIGAGIIGLTTAYELSRSGIDVTVIERNSSSAEETSFANAGLIAEGHAFAWGNPAIFRQLLNPSSNTHSAFSLKWSWDRQFLGWGMNFLRNCTSKRFYRNTKAKQEMCRYSHTILSEIIDDEKIDCCYNGNGLLYLHRDIETLTQTEAKLKTFPDLIPELKILNSHDLVEFDSSFNKSPVSFAGAVYCPNDASGDCFTFTKQLEHICINNGVHFRFNKMVNRIIIDKGNVKSIETENDQLDADIFVIACGPFTPVLCRKVGINIPIYPVKGYSLTLPIIKVDRIPKVNGIDEENFTAFCRIDDKMRITSRAELCGYDKSIDPKTVQKLIINAKQIFADALDYKNPNPWTGLRPATPTGPPFVSATKFPNVYVNSGHGHLGWTMACGSARLLKDIILKLKPEISPIAYSL